ncbi:MAG: type II secretion system F family protein [Alphaproteobacteria bacterium]|nr:type II secretion system F family protein [Alphaproteobacteria bacterium]
MNNIQFIIIGTLLIFILLNLCYFLIAQKRRNLQIEDLLNFKKNKKTKLNLNSLYLCIIIGSYFISLYLFLILFALYILKKSYLYYVKQRNFKFFETNFMNNLEQLARLLSAGLPMSKALEILSQHPSCFGQEIGRILKEIAIGKDITLAFKESSILYPLQSYQYFTTILSLQYETGTSIKEMLENLYALLREKKKLAQKAKALSAEARFSIYLIGFLPVGLFLALWILNPNYIADFLKNPNASLVLLMAFGFWGIGFFWMFQLTRFKHG